MEIRPATATDIPDVRRLLQEYLTWIGLDLAFQEIDAELAQLPGDYVPPRGALLVADDGAAVVAMIGMRPLENTICEMKRLYVKPTARGLGLAGKLIARILDAARVAGYEEMRLDTLPMMGDAQALYERFGFVDIAPYYETPIAGTRFMSRRL